MATKKKAKRTAVSETTIWIEFESTDEVFEFESTDAQKNNESKKIASARKKYLAKPNAAAAKKAFEPFFSAALDFTTVLEQKTFDGTETWGEIFNVRFLEVNAGETLPGPDGNQLLGLELLSVSFDDDHFLPTASARLRFSLASKSRITKAAAEAFCAALDEFVRTPQFGWFVGDDTGVVEASGSAGGSGFRLLAVAGELARDEGEPPAATGARVAAAAPVKKAASRFSDGELELIRGRICQNPSAPESLLNRLLDVADATENGGIYIGLAKNIALSDGLKEALGARLSETDDDMPSWRSDAIDEAIASFSGAPGDLVSAVAERAFLIGGLREAIAVHPNLPAAQRAALLASFTKEVFGDGEELFALARSRYVDSAWLESMAKAKNPWMRRVAAVSPHTPEALLQKLASDTGAGAKKNADLIGVCVREAVASNPSLSASLQKLLQKDSHHRVRAALSRNENVEGGILEVLSNDVAEDVRGAVASNPRLAVSAYQRLAREDEVQVQTGVAKSPNIDSKTMNALAEHEDEDVRRAIATNPGTPGDLLAVLAKDESESVKEAVAASTGCPKATLADFADRASAEVCANVASNPMAEEATLAALAAV
jgi:hypothetical protein